jgi:protoporphyrinogen/coproporphyrinogen III oxidase
VRRWGGALPQYSVGHTDRIAAVRAAVARQPALAICGAAFEGVGIAACVAAARTAADGLARRLTEPLDGHTTDGADTMEAP